MNMNDQTLIEATIQTYFDCMYESSAEKTKRAFHADAKVVGYLDEELHVMSVTDFANFVESQQPSPKVKGDAIRLEILSIDIAGKTAVAKVRDDYLGMTFLDTLSLLKTDGDWTIYNKLFHVESTSD